MPKTDKIPCTVVSTSFNISNVFVIYIDCFNSSERTVLTQEIVPWALYAGYRSQFLLNVYFEQHFEKDIDRFRKEINLVVSPTKF